MSVEFICWIGLCEMYNQFVDSDDMPVDAIYPYIKEFAESYHYDFCNVLNALYTSYMS